MFFRKKKIESFERMTLRVTGMRDDDEFEAVCCGDTVEVSLYRMYYAYNERRLEGKSVCSTKDFIEMLNICNLANWDGFHGKHPKHVKDGTMFSMEATVDGETTIHADGSENFPRGYQNLENAFYRMIRESQSSEGGS